MADPKDITYTVTEAIGVLSENGKRTVELNMVSWNGGPAKYDLRHWRVNMGEKFPNKGIALDEDEARALYALLKARFGA